jgi:predicted nucleic acid-binding protein
MKVLFDTSVLVAAFVENHPMHSRALPWLQGAKRKEFEFLVAAHTVAELYAVLTVLPLKPRISPANARQLLEVNVEGSARIIPLSVSDYTKIIKQLSDAGLTGGIVYDALIVAAARKAKVDRLLTFNVGDFQLIWPLGADHIFAP